VLEVPPVDVAVLLVVPGVLVAAVVVVVVELEPPPVELPVADVALVSDEVSLVVSGPGSSPVEQPTAATTVPKQRV
jgi:hypothetical protein